MFTRIMKEKDGRDAGFTLIELLVVVAIIGILAAIAIPVFLNQRASAYDASVKADLNGIAKVMETVYADTGTYPATETDTAFTDLNPVVSQANEIVVTTSSNPDAFTIVGCNAGSQKEFTYDSQTGGLAADPTSTTNTCGATAGQAGTLTVN